jgi:DNA-binding winged helix-turn-helix (wHTH) protein
MTSGAVDLPVYDFGPFRLDPAERLLVRDGQPVSLTPKVFDLLVYLVERHGRLVEKQALLSALWPDAIVEEANLAYNVSALRKVLDDEVEGFSMIQTVPTRGYRFTQRVVATRLTAEPVLLPSSADADSTVFVPTVADGRRSWRSLSEWISTVVGVRVRDSIWMMLATLAAASIALFATRFAVESPAERGEPTELMLNEQPVSIRNVSSPALVAGRSANCVPGFRARPPGPYLGTQAELYAL